MPSLIGNYIGSNYLLTTPTSRFGTRELETLVVEVTNVATDAALPNSLFTRSVRALQQNAEIFAVFNPSGNQFTALVARDTLPLGDDAGNGGRNSYLEDALSAAGISGAVWNAEINGSNISYD